MEHGEVTHISGKRNSGSYLPSLVPAVDSNLASFAVVVVATGVAMLSISDNALVTKVTLTLEGLVSVRQPFGTPFDPVLVSQSGAETSIGFALIFSTVALGLFSYNSYDSAINYSEETKGEA